MDIIKALTEELGIRPGQTEAAVKLIDEGNTIPFIARYRKEATGSLDDGTLRDLDKRLKYLRGLEEKKEQVLSAVQEQGKMTKEFRAAIEGAMTLAAVEDLYRPYRPRRRTRAMIAKEKGLELLAEAILLQTLSCPPEKEAEKYVDLEKGVETVEDALQGARDIIAEQISDQAPCRTFIRRLTTEEGFLVSVARDAGADSVYNMYYDFREPVKKVAEHRILAVNRGEAQKFLTVKIEAPEEQILTYLGNIILKNDNPHTAPVLKAAAADSYKRLIAPAIEREIRNELTERAEDSSVRVFGRNLAQLLLQPPIVGQTVLGWDPGFRTGCKLAVVDATGKVLDTAVVFATAGSKRQREESKNILKDLICKYGVTLISIGNGTASRESEQVIVELLKELDEPVRYIITNEAGASVYSASLLAAEEFPDYDVAQRSAVSIARRLQDPLAELVKIDPKSIGVGQYQHDMDQKKLGEALNGVVEDCVNRVGVDLNTASVSLLEYVSGLSKTTARNIVVYREKNGRFTDRKQLLKVAKLGPRAYEQCAGFLRILGGKNPLDATAVHPESYETATALMERLGYSLEDLRFGGLKDIGKKARNTAGLAGFLGVGEITLEDLIMELEKPSRDPREELPRPVLRTDVLEPEDLLPGMVLKGTVRNVIDFGAFVDIGVHQDGLVHISQICDRYLKHPLEAVSVGDIVEVKVLSVDIGKKRIQLTMKL